MLVYRRTVVIVKSTKVIILLDIHKNNKYKKQKPKQQTSTFS